MILLVLLYLIIMITSHKVLSYALNLPKWVSQSSFPFQDRKTDRLERNNFETKLALKLKLYTGQNVRKWCHYVTGLGCFISKVLMPPADFPRPILAESQNMISSLIIINVNKRQRNSYLCILRKYHGKNRTFITRFFSSFTIIQLWKFSFWPQRRVNFGTQVII